MRAILLKRLFITLFPQPASRAFLTHARRECLIEIRIAACKNALMPQFMKDNLSQVGVGFKNEGVEHRVLEPTEGRISLHAAHRYVVAFSSDISRVIGGAWFGEITAIL